MINPLLTRGVIFWAYFSDLFLEEEDRVFAFEPVFFGMFVFLAVEPVQDLFAEKRFMNIQFHKSDVYGTPDF